MKNDCSKLDIILLGWQLSNCGFHSSIWSLIIDSNRHSTIHKIAEKLHVSHTCIENHLKQLGYVQKLDTWFLTNWKKSI